MKYENLERLNNLREKGAITEEEYQREKEKVLNNPNDSNSQELLGMSLNTYCMLIHLSQFLGYVIPFAGLIAPIILWSINKDKYKEVDTHGRVVLNWMISSVIYYIICFVLIIILLGIPLIFAMLAVNFIFVIIGGVKANDGIVWKYPMSIEFFKV